MNKTYEEILSFVKDVVENKIPYMKLEPCISCSFDLATCSVCEKYKEWRDYIKVSPINQEEKETMEFIYELKKMCKYTK